MTTPFYSQGGGTTPVGTIPVIPVKSNRAPTASDITGVNGPFPLGQSWIDQSNGIPYILTQLTPQQKTIVATWVASGGAASGVQTLSGNSGVAVPVLGNILLSGGTGISTSASGSTVTITSTQPTEFASVITNVAGPVVPTATGQLLENASVTTYTDGTTANTVKIEVQSSPGSILVGAGTNIKATPLAASATAGIPIVSTGSVPVYGTAVVAGGGTGNTTFTPYSVITGGTTTTSHLQSVVGVGTAGQVLTSNGANALPTWQGEQGVTAIQVDAFTAPGTNPVTPSAGNIITITGGQVAAGTIGSAAIRTNSLAANSFSIQVQRSSAVVASDITKNGICHFNSADFNVNANGFVSATTRGSFTPVIQFGGASTGITYQAQTGSYTQIGNIVAFAIYLDMTNKGTATGLATLTGLPVTVGTSSQFTFVQSEDLMFVPGYSMVSINFNQTTTTATFYCSGDNVTLSNISDANFSNTTTLRIQGIYLA